MVGEKHHSPLAFTDLKYPMTYRVKRERQLGFPSFQTFIKTNAKIVI